MGKFLNFLANVSFTGYIIREHKITKDIANSAYSTVEEDKQKLIEVGGQLPLAVKQVSDGIAADKIEIGKRPVVRGRAEFYDETGLTPAQLRAKQLEVLKKVNRYNGLIDKEADNIGKLNDIRNDWEARLSAKVVVKAKKVPATVVESICKQLYDVDSKDLSDALLKGCALKKIFSYNEAVITVNHLLSYNIKAKVVECNAEKDVTNRTKQRDSELDLKAIALHQRFFLSGLVLLGFIFILVLSILIYGSADVGGSIFVVVAGVVAAAVLFLVLWLLTKPILALAWRVVNLSFEKNAEKLIDRIGYLRGVVLSETFEKGLDVLYNGLIDCINGYMENSQTVEDYAKIFLPERVYAGLLPMVIEQMSIGAVFNDALFKTEATIDRRRQCKSRKSATRGSKRRTCAIMPKWKNRQGAAPTQRSRERKQPEWQWKSKSGILRP